VTDLPDIAEALNRRCVDREERGSIQADVVPQRIPDDLSFGRALHSGLYVVSP
jgi:hypothetical protein